MPEHRPPWPVRSRPGVLAQVRTELGRGGLFGVAVTGEAGSGKTTLATQIGAEVGAGGGVVLLVRGTALVAGVPYGALAPYLDDLPADVTSAGAPPNPLVATRALQHRLRRLEGSGDPLVVVDNLADVDEHSAHVLAALAGAGALRLLVVADDITAGPEAVVDLWRDGLLGAVVIPSWTPDEVDAAVETFLGGSVSASLRRHLHSSSGGNPMLLRHLLELGVLSGGLVMSDGTWTFDAYRWSSPEVNGLLNAPLARWGPTQREVLELISLTDHVPLPAVERMLSQEQLDSLQRAGMVAVDPPGGLVGSSVPTVRLGSPALGRAISRQVPWSRRRAVLETALSLGVGTGDPTARQELALAELVLNTGAVLDPALAVRAAHTALLQHDAPLALRLTDAVPDGEHTVRATVLRSQGLRSLGQGQQAVAALDDLRSRRWAAMSPDDQVAWAVERAETVRYAPPADRQAVLDLLDSLRSAAPVDGSTGPGEMLDTAWASLAFSGGRYAELVDRLLPVHAAGTGSGVERWALCGSILAAALAALGRQREAVEVAGEVEAVWRLGELPADLAILILAGLNVALLTCGRGDRVLDNISLQGAQDPYRDPRDGGVNDLGLGLVYLFRGDGHRALVPLRSAVGETALRDAFQMAGLTRAALAWAEALAGNQEAARTELGRYSPTTWLDYDGPVSPLFSISGARLELGDDIADDVVARGRALLAAGHHGNAAVVLSQAARHGSAAAVELLRGMTMDQPGRWMRAAHDHAEGIATSNAGLLLRTAQSLLADGDRRFAADAAAAALVVPDAPPDVVRAANRILQTARWRNNPAAAPGSDRGPLTPRERDVAERAARRLTNAEIASSLHLSVRTVESYLQSAFGKLGINSRTELGAALGSPGDDTAGRRPHRRSASG